MAKCAIIHAEDKGRARCPFCRKLLPGRYPVGVSYALLLCPDRKCRGHKEEIIVNIPAGQQRQPFSTP